MGPHVSRHFGTAWHSALRVKPDTDSRHPSTCRLHAQRGPAAPYSHIHAGTIKGFARRHHKYSNRSTTCSATSRIADTDLLPEPLPPVPGPLSQHQPGNRITTPYKAVNMTAENPSLANPGGISDPGLIKYAPHPLLPLLQLVPFGRLVRH